MKICFVTSQAISYHATLKRAFGMALPLSELDHDVTIVLLDHPSNRDHFRDLPKVRAAYFPPCSALAERRWKERFLATERFDVVFCSSLGFRNAVRAPQCETISLMEHCELESAFQGNSNPRRAAQFLLEWMSLRFDGSIAASKYLEHLIRRRSFALRRHHPVCWLPYAYNPEELEVDEAARAQLRAFADGRKLIVSLGTLNVHYGSVFLLDALAVLSAMRQDWVAVCPGSGQDLELTRNHCKQLGLESRVRYPGYVDRHEVGSHLVSANVLVSHLNDTEQDWARCPSKTYLYLGAQRPIVTPAIGENPIALGASGFYYDGRSPESMAQALSAALDAERNGWTPPDPSEHTWKRRVEEWVQWLYQEFPQLRDGSRK